MIKSMQQSMLPSVSVNREQFPLIGNHEFDDLWVRHGIEVRGKPLDLDRQRYTSLQKQGRLVWVVGRSDFGVPVGYSCSHWGRDLNFNEQVAWDGLWFVTPSARGVGLGTELKRVAHAELKRHGCVRVYDLIRDTEHNKLLGEVGFTLWGMRWVKEL
jgi:Acetyltransferase (GNAT) family